MESSDSNSLDAYNSKTAASSLTQLSLDVKTGKKLSKVLHLQKAEKLLSVTNSLMKIFCKKMEIKVKSQGGCLQFSHTEENIKAMVASAIGVEY